jgi:hypothetical protein
LINLEEIIIDKKKKKQPYCYGNIYKLINFWIF